jgi:hypothetical protein
MVATASSPIVASSITLSGGSVCGSGAGNGLYTEDPSSMIEATGVTITWTDFKGVRAWQATGSVGAPPDVTVLFGGTVITNGQASPDPAVVHVA